jgi:hypothetical protein
MGQELITAAQAIENLLTVAANEGDTSVPITVDDVVAMQQDLASGWTQQEIDDAHTIGLTDADLEAIRQGILNANPEDLAGDLVVNMQEISTQLFQLGMVLEYPPSFDPGYHVGAGLNQSVTINNAMAQVYDQVTTFQLSNPGQATSEFSLSVRRLSLPADWTVDVSPAQITLDPGQQVTITVSIIAGSPVPQGGQPLVGVEAYANGELLSGVVIEVMVPQYHPFDGFLHNYLSITTK